MALRGCRQQVGSLASHTRRVGYEAVVEHGIRGQWLGHGPLERLVDSRECRYLHLSLCVVVPQAEVTKVVD